MTPQREIKFRVWNGSEMVYDVIVGIFGIFYVNRGTTFGLDENDSASLTSFNTRYPDNTPVMQWTGLKDCKGNDIWEGDILCWPEYEGKKYQQRWVVEWNDVKSGWSDWSPRKQAEVIGNLYENPELLK